MLKKDILSSIAEIVQDSIGLNFTTKRLVDLERGIIASAKELNIKENIEEIFLWISTNKLTSREWQIIASHLTIGETYFFREPLSLNLFIKKIIPEFISKRADNSKHLRIWCAGCSSGEEPYTLAILIKENFPDMNNWNISIHATDINLNSIHKAQKGEYTQWSFRETKPEIRNKYFISKSNHWIISPEIIKMVDFSYLNLADNNYPSIQTKTDSIDIIFCRNVLMYFSPVKIPEVAERLNQSLVEGGYFITSQVELNDLYFSIFKKFCFENAFYYRKQIFSSSEKTKVNVIPVTVSNNVKGNINISLNKIKEDTLRKIKKSIPKRSIEPKHIVLDDKSFLEKAQDCANKGNYNESLEFLDKIILANADDEDIYYLYGTILYEIGKHDEAVAKLKKGLYLNPNHFFSHVMLGNFQRVGGNQTIANKHYKNALELLEKWKEEEIVPFSDGMTKGRLRVMIENFISNRN